MKNKIIFIPKSQSNQKEDFEILYKPEPAKNFLPIWWKKSDSFQKDNDGKLLIPPIPTFKGCIPFLDSLTSGYMAYTTQELFVNSKNNFLTIHWNNWPEPLLSRSDNTEGLPVPLGCNKQHFAWNFNYGMVLPKGYSALFTHPLNRHDLPFVTSSAIVDQGVWWTGSFSFWLKENFTGIIPINTPIVQIIPFKRENWTSELRPDLKSEADKKNYERDNYLYGFYKKFIRQEKIFK